MWKKEQKKKKFHSQIPSFLSVIIASRLRNCRSAVFVFASLDKTGEEKPVYAGLDASFLQGLFQSTYYPSWYDMSTEGDTMKQQPSLKKVHCQEMSRVEKIFPLHHWELVSLYKSLTQIVLRINNRTLFSRKSCREKCVTVNFGRIIYSLEYKWFHKWKAGLTLYWKMGCEGGWGKRVWEMWLWCKEDGINLLSLQCAFIPNGSDMSRAQQYLPSHCTGEGRTHEK